MLPAFSDTIWIINCLKWVYKGEKTEIKAHARKQSDSVDGFTNRAVNMQLERDKDKSRILLE